MTGTPSAANVGPNPVTLVASDGVNSAQQSFTITVTAVNDPPAFTSTAPTAGTEGVLYTYTATATDPDGDTLTFAAPTRPAWLTLSGATLSGTPGQANVGTHNVTITVSDGTAAPVAQSFQIVVANVNDPPVFTSTAPTAATQGVAYTYTATATDPDGNTLTFAAPTRPSWLTLSGATLSGTPGQANVGTHSVTITVSDGTAAAVAQSFQIVVADANDPPVFTSTAPTAATQGVAYTYTATATDPDGNTLTFAAPTLPAWLTLSGATLSGTPAQANVGTHSVTITVSDGTAAPVAQSFQITVADANDPPVFTSTAPTAATQGAVYTYTATATDPDGNTLTFAAPTRPAWLTLSGATLSGTPAQANVGTHSVTITVSDGTAAPVAQSFQIVVADVNDRAGLHEHRADGGHPRRALHLYRNGQRSRRQHADICGADASGLAHAVRCDALRHSGSSQRRHAQPSRSRCRMALRLRSRNRSKSSSPTRTIRRSSRARRRRRRLKACSTPTPPPLPIQMRAAHSRSRRRRVPCGSRCPARRSRALRVKPTSARTTS